MSHTLSNRFYALFVSVFFLFAGFGLFLNSAGVKLSQMGVNNIAIGALNAAFFCGASLSAVAAHRIVSNVGHIRSFSVFGAVFAMCSLAHLMTDNLYAWGVLRLVLGFCYFSMLMVVESWFGEQSAQEKRAKILAVYNLVYYFAFTVGIVLLSLNLSSDNIFVLGTLLVMVAMIPVSLTRMNAPAIPPRQSINVPRVFGIAPLAFVTAFTGGLMVNGLFTMASVFLLQQQFDIQEISAFLTAAMLGGFLIQLPMAKLSDRFGRRNAILVCAVLSAFTAAVGLGAMMLGQATLWLHNGVAFMFGCGLFTLYALSIARANDRLPNDMNTVEVARSLLFCYGLGSLVAPMLLGVITNFAPAYGFYTFYLVSAGLLAFFAWKQPTVPQQERSVFVNAPPVSGSMAVELDPRNEAEHQLFDAAVAAEHVAALDGMTVAANTPDKTCVSLADTADCVAENQRVLVLQAPDLSQIALPETHNYFRLPENLSGKVARLPMNHETLPEAVQAELVMVEVDFAVLPERAFGDIKLIVSDMDSTLINIECIDEIAAGAGLKEQVAAITERAMRGELDFEQSLRSRVALLKGLPESRLQEVYDKVLQLNAGAEYLLQQCQAHNIRFVLVSGGFTFFTDKLKTRLGFEHAYANVLEVENGFLTGQVIGRVIDAQAKADILMQHQIELGCRNDQVIALGDGANDVPMLHAAGIGIAYHAKPKAQNAADLLIQHNGLEAVRGWFR